MREYNVRVPSRIASAMSSFGREALRIVLPSWCAACGRELAWDARVASCCASCWNAMRKIELAQCRSCALPLPGYQVDQLSGYQVPPDHLPTRQPDNQLCIACLENPLPLAWCEAWGEYRDGLEAVIHAFKFERHEFLDRPLTELMAATLRDRDFDAVVPVPMHRVKKRKRGYNQAELLAVALAERLRLPMLPLLEKTKEKRTQSKLARADRAGNVRNTFAAHSLADGKSVLLVDDVCTTGETLRACARKLITAGASRVCAVTVAKAV